MGKRRFTNEQIASFMEMKTMGITDKHMAREYGCDPKTIRDAVDNAKVRGMDHVSDAEFSRMLHMPELIGQPSRMNRASTAYTVEGVE